jgi:hypothetical protein
MDSKSHEWDSITSDISKRMLIEEYIRRRLSESDDPRVSENKSISNVMGALSGGKLSSRDVIMGSDRISTIRNLKMVGSELRVSDKRSSVAT